MRSQILVGKIFYLFYIIVRSLTKCGLAKQEWIIYKILLYVVIQKDNRFEIREYEEYTVAEVEINGDFTSALQKVSGSGGLYFWLEEPKQSALKQD
jgi:hypothetical protein